MGVSSDPFPKPFLFVYARLRGKSLREQAFHDYSFLRLTRPLPQLAQVNHIPQYNVHRRASHSLSLPPKTS